MWNILDEMVSKGFFEMMTSEQRPERPNEVKENGSLRGRGIQWRMQRKTRPVCIRLYKACV